jgi:hypothetical protein
MLNVFVLNVIMLSVFIMLSVIMMNVIMLGVNLLSVIMMNVIMLSVIMLSVVILKVVEASSLLSLLSFSQIIQFLEEYVKAGNPNRKGILSTVDLLFKLGSFEQKRKI